MRTLVSRPYVAVIAVLAVSTVVLAARARTQPPTDVVFTIQPAVQFPISRFIYGANFLTDGGPGTEGQAPWYGATLPTGLTLNRLGGNRLSAYNWRINASNAGRDYRYQNDRMLGASSSEGDAVRTRMQASIKRGAAMLVTVPMLPFVAGDASGIALDSAESTAGKRLADHFVPNRASRNPGDPPKAVYQDEFVRWLDGAFPALKTSSTTPAFFSLDNEPDIWHDTHEEIMTRRGGRPALQNYVEFVATSMEYARAIKKSMPQAVVFGPAVATYTGVLTLGRYPTPDPTQGSRSFLEFYLERMRGEELRTGRRLLDVLDVHWYPANGTRAGEVTNDYAVQNDDMINARVQAPRSLWDPTFDEDSWVSKTTSGPIALIPRLKKMIATFYPGTKIAISEYYYGRGGDISGGIAQADVLGILGREGVFAASLWPQAGVWSQPYGGVGDRAYAYVFGAFRLFRNFDGAGSTFGDTGVRATTSDVVNSSVYASRDSKGRLVLVAINKTAETVRARLAIAGDGFRRATMWTIRAGVVVPFRQPDIVADAGAPLTIVMPPLSASTVVVTP